MRTLAMSFLVLALVASNSFAQNNDAKLKERLNASVNIIVGKVTDVKKASVPPHGISEHNMDWSYAEVRVKSVLKGVVSNKTIKVYFPASVDILQFHHPKFKQGQEGIWLLSPTTDHNLKNYDGSANVAPDPLDFQPMNQLSKVKKLLK